jgi:hypothetical protein
VSDPRSTFYKLTEAVHYSEVNPGPPHNTRIRTLAAGIITEAAVLEILGMDALLRLRDAGILVDPKKPEPVDPQTGNQ